METSKKTLKITIAVLIAGLLISSTLAYTLWITRPASFHARIKTTIDFNMFTDPDCLIPFTEYDFGEYGAQEKREYVYIKNIGNDKVNITWNLTSGTGWYKTEDGRGYTDDKFYFKVYLTEYNTWNPDTYQMLEVGQVINVFFKCSTEEFLPHETIWEITFYGYDTNT